MSFGFITQTQAAKMQKVKPKNENQTEVRSAGQHSNGFLAENSWKYFLAKGPGCKLPDINKCIIWSHQTFLELKLVTVSGQRGRRITKGGGGYVRAHFTLRPGKAEICWCRPKDGVTRQQPSFETCKEIIKVPCNWHTSIRLMGSFSLKLWHNSWV